MYGGAGQQEPDQDPDIVNQLGDLKDVRAVTGDETGDPAVPRGLAEVCLGKGPLIDIGFEQDSGRAGLLQADVNLILGELDGQEL